MATPTTNYGFPLPEQTTSPPDVVKWLGDLATAADASLKAVDDAKLAKTGGTVTGTLYVSDFALNKISVHPVPGQTA